MNENSIKVFAPATVANVACGFDILGFALQAPGDLITATLNEKAGVTIRSIKGDGGRLPLEPLKNSASYSVIKLLEFLNRKEGIALDIEKQMPLGSGLGSSAASAAAAVFAVNKLLGDPLSVKDLVPFAMEGEKVACGSAHADNVAPALMGGFVLIRSYTPLDIVRIPVSLSLHCVIIKPQVEVLTKEARKALGDSVSLNNFVTQTGNLGGLLIGLMKGDQDLISRSLIDVIAEPIRALLIPGFHHIKKAALEAGALGCSISGSGPSIFALCADETIAAKVSEATLQTCLKAGIHADHYLSEIHEEGARIVS